MTGDPTKIFRNTILFNPGLKIWFFLSLAGYGTFFILRILGSSLTAGVLGGLMTGLTPYGFGLVNAGHLNKIFAMAYVPWVLAAILYFIGGIYQIDEQERGVGAIPLHVRGRVARLVAPRSQVARILQGLRAAAQIGLCGRLLGLHTCCIHVIGDRRKVSCGPLWMVGRVDVIVGRLLIVVQREIAIQITISQRVGEFPATKCAIIILIK